MIALLAALGVAPTTMPPRCPAEGRAVAVSRASLFVESCGTGPAVVLIHGGNTDRRMWNAELAAWSPRHRVIRYDVRGFGKSTRPEESYASHEDLAAILDTLGVRQVTIVGLSLGGRIAIDFALTHPDRVRSLVLAGPGMSGFPWSRGRDPAMERIAAALQRRDSVGAAEAWLETGYMKPAMEQPKLRAWVRQLAVENSRSWSRTDEERELDPPAYGRLKEIRVPVLVVVGSRDIPDIQRIVDRLTQELPNATRATIPGAGHMVNLERPDDFDRAVRPFLDQ
jgi:pimeloyl-ACP methyl ester carboxylesterase